MTGSLDMFICQPERRFAVLLSMGGGDDDDGGGDGGSAGGLIGPGCTCKCQGQMLGWSLHLHFAQARDE